MRSAMILEVTTTSKDSKDFNKERGVDKWNAKIKNKKNKKHTY